MSELDEVQKILAVAQQRGVEHGLSYAGAMTPREAYQILQTHPQARLVDVRTQAELELVGRIPQAIHIEWASYPGMVANPAFPQQLSGFVAQNPILIFMCRTGGRSHNAAALAATLGLTQAYNMLEGFEGNANERRQRCTLNGWKVADLPWTN